MKQLLIVCFMFLAVVCFAGEQSLSLQDLENTEWSGVYTKKNGRPMGKVELMLQDIDPNRVIIGTIKLTNMAGKVIGPEHIINPELKRESETKYVFSFSSDVAHGETADARLFIKMKGKHAGKDMEGDVEFKNGEVMYKLYKKE